MDYKKKYFKYKYKYLELQNKLKTTYNFSGGSNFYDIDTIDSIYGDNIVPMVNNYPPKDGEENNIDSDIDENKVDDDPEKLDEKKIYNKIEIEDIEDN